MKRYNRILRAIAVEPNSKHYGLSLARNAKVSAGGLYPTLIVMEQEGIISSDWEVPDPDAPVVKGYENSGPRPRRRYYKITEKGARIARLLLGDDLNRGM